MPPINVDYRVPVEDHNWVLLQMHGSERKASRSFWVPDWSVPKNFALTMISYEDLDALDQIDNRAATKESDNLDELVLGVKRLDVIGWRSMAVSRFLGKGDIMRSVEAALKDWVAMVANVP